MERPSADVTPPPKPLPVQDDVTSEEKAESKSDSTDDEETDTASEADDTDDDDDDGDVTLPQDDIEPTAGASVKPLSELFRKKEGEGECDVCLVRNPSDVIQCAACDTPKPGCEEQVAAQKTTSSAAGANSC